MKKTYQLEYQGNNYSRYEDDEKICYWIKGVDHNKDNIVSPTFQVFFEGEYLKRCVYEPAAKHAGLKYPFDRKKEQHHNPSALAQYDAWIAEYMHHYSNRKKCSSN